MHLPGFQGQITAREDGPRKQTVSLRNSGSSTTGPSTPPPVQFRSISQVTSLLSVPQGTSSKWSSPPHTSDHLISTHSQMLTPTSHSKENNPLERNSLSFLIAHLFPTSLCLLHQTGRFFLWDRGIFTHAWESNYSHFISNNMIFFALFHQHV